MTNLKQIINEIVDKKLNEADNKSAAQSVRDWFISKGLEVDLKGNVITVKKDGNEIFSRKSNSFFRTAHLESFVNQVAKILGIKNDFNEFMGSPPKGPKFYRLTSETIGNELFPLTRSLDSLYKSLSNGNDYNPRVMKSIISALQNIDKKAKAFTSKEDVESSGYL